MASDKTPTRKTQKTDDSTVEAPTRKAKPAKSGAGEGEAAVLRTKDDPRSERRFEPKASPLAIVSVTAMAIGAVLVGAGTYAQWFRGDELGPLKQAPYLLAAGAFLLLAVALFGQRLEKPIRVGDAGIAREKEPTEIERIEWRDVTRLVLTRDALTVQGVGTSIAVPLDVHRPAAERLAAEIRARLPKRAPDLEGSVNLSAPSDAAGEPIALEPPQIAGAHCKKSERVITFEKDARLCGRCGEVYHKDSIPKRCLTCDARLKG